MFCIGNRKTGVEVSYRLAFSKNPMKFRGQSTSFLETVCQSRISSSLFYEMAAYMHVMISTSRKKKYYRSRIDHTIDDNLSDEDIYRKYRFTRGKFESRFANKA